MSWFENYDDLDSQNSLDFVTPIVSPGISYARSLNYSEAPEEDLIVAKVICPCGKIEDVLLESITWSASKEVRGIYPSIFSVWSDDQVQKVEKYILGREVIVGSLTVRGPANPFEKFHKPFTLVIDSEWGTTVLSGVTVTQGSAGYHVGDLGNTSSYSFVALGLKSVNK